MDKAESSMDDVHDLNAKLAARDKELADQQTASREQEQDAVKEERSFLAQVIARCESVILGSMILLFKVLHIPYPTSDPILLSEVW